MNAGYNLQILVDQDIRENPQSYQVEHPDKNIDFRRVRNLNVYFKRHALSLTLDIYDLDKWQGGDIVIFKNILVLFLIIEIKGNHFCDSPCLSSSILL